MKTLIVILASLTFCSVDHAHAIGPAPIRSALSSLDRANGSLVNKEKRAITRSADCDDAKVWKTKLVDVVDANGNPGQDGVPDETRARTSIAGVGMVLGTGEYSGQRLGSGFAYGGKYLVSVAHIFSKKGEETEYGKDVVVQIEGCPGETYRVIKKDLSTTSPTMTSDSSVLELDRPYCENANGLEFGVPGIDPASLEGTDVIVSGFYEKSDLESEDTSASSLTSTIGKTGPYEQYSSVGKIEKSGINKNQLLFTYKAGQTKGGSGGPIMMRNGDGNLVVVGIQYKQPDEKDFNFNFGLGSSGSFYDFVTSVVQ